MASWKKLVFVVRSIVSQHLTEKGLAGQGPRVSCETCELFHADRPSKPPCPGHLLPSLPLLSSGASGSLRQFLLVCIDMSENKLDNPHPHPPHWQNTCARNMPSNEGSYGVTSLALLLKKEAFTDFYGIGTPTFMAYEPRLLWHTKHFYWGWGWSLIYWMGPQEVQRNYARLSLPLFLHFFRLTMASLESQSTLDRGQVNKNYWKFSCGDTKRQRASQKSLAPGQTRSAPVHPHVAPAQCLQRPFAPSPKHFRQDQLIWLLSQPAWFARLPFRLWENVESPGNIRHMRGQPGISCLLSCEVAALLKEMSSVLLVAALSATSQCKNWPSDHLLLASPQDGLHLANEITCNRTKGSSWKGSSSPKRSLEFLNSLDSLKFLNSGWILLLSLHSKDFLESAESLDGGPFWKEPFANRPLFQAQHALKQCQVMTLHVLSGSIWFIRDTLCICT